MGRLKGNNMHLKVIININHSSLKNINKDIDQENDIKEQKIDNPDKIEDKKINPLDLI